MALLPCTGSNGACILLSVPVTCYICSASRLLMTEAQRESDVVLVEGTDEMQV